MLLRARLDKRSNIRMTELPPEQGLVQHEDVITRASSSWSICRLLLCYQTDCFLKVVTTLKGMWSFLFLKFVFYAGIG